MDFDQTHFSIDTETLSYYDNAIITSVAITPFNFKKDKDATFVELLARTFYVKLDQKIQLKDLGRKTDKGTIDWWKTQSAELRKLSVVPADDDVDPYTALVDMIPKFLKEHKYEYWGSYFFERGMGYDSTKIDTLYRALGEDTTKKRIMNFFMYREIRTLNDLLGGTTTGKWIPEGGNPSSFIEHVASHDAAMDAYRLIRLVNSTLL